MYPLYKATLRAWLCGQKGRAPFDPHRNPGGLLTSKNRHMAYGIIRVRELTRGEVRATDIHNERKYQEHGIATPGNIDPERSKYNDYRSSTGENLMEAINIRLDDAKVKSRSNSVVAIEFVMSASPEFFDSYSAGGWFANCRQWLGERYGLDNIVSQSEHYDETNPHVHFVVTPIVEKEVSWKNQKGSGTRKENRLCARDLTGNKELLSQLQTDYHEFIKPAGKAVGVEFFRGTKASNELKEYTKHTDHRIGEVRTKLAAIEREFSKISEMLKNGQISPEVAKSGTDVLIERQNGLKEQKTVISDEFKRLQDEANQKEARRDNYNANGKWKKGKDFSPGF